MAKGLIARARANCVAYLALFVALGGTGYAASQLPAGSVGTRQLRDGSVTPAKLQRKTITGSVRAWAVVLASGKVLRSGGGLAVRLALPPSEYQIRWATPLPRSCATSATIDSTGSAPTETVSVPGDPSLQETAGSVTVVPSGAVAHGGSSTIVTTFNQSGQPTPLSFDVAVIC